jgi:hypothetical protein
MNENFQIDFELRSIKLDIKNIKICKNLHLKLIFEYAVLAFKSERNFE